MDQFNPFGSTLNTVLWFTNEGINLLGWAFGVPWLGLVAQFLEDFAQWLASFFSGRPAVGIDSATDDVALFLIPSPNPVVAMWGMGIRSIEAQGIPLSTSNPVNAAKYEKLAGAVLADLQAQFGQAPGQSIYNLYAQASAMHNPDSNPNALALRTEVDSLYTKAVQNGTLDPKTGLPPKTPVTSPQPPSAPPPPPPGGDQDQDEFQDCCDETQTALGNILDAIKGMPQGTDQTCCANIVTAIGQVATAIAGVTAKIPAGGEPAAPVDLTPVVTALTALAAAVAAYEPLLTALVAALNVNLPEITAGISPGLTAPLESIAASLASKLGTLPEDPAAKAKVEAFVKQAVADGLLQADLGQIITA